mgnify:FL=1|jgi:uncharacterized protein with PQ loop repeat
MFGYLGTILLVWQMSALANGAPQWALIIGVFAACAWLVHGWQNADKPIMITNALLLIIAMYGLIYN